MPVTDEQPFLDAVFARYHDDGPRLIYADYLEDAGDPARAELVRVQLALPNLPDEDPRKADLANRVAELLVANVPRWTEHLSDLLLGHEFRRGVLDSVSVDSEVFLTRGEELFARVPVRRLMLIDDAGLLPSLINSPLLSRVRELDLCNNDLSNGGVDLLTRSPFFKDLEELQLGFNGIDDAGVIALARASSFPSLKKLGLNDNGAITGVGLQALAASPFFAGLNELDISGNDIGEPGVRAALTSPSFARLQTLHLDRNPIGDAGAIALAQSSLLARMVARSASLKLRGHAGGPIGPAGASALATSPALAKCSTLDLTGNDLGDAGLAVLANSPQLAELRVLKLGRNQITDAGILAIHEALPALLARLRLLDLSENRLTRYGTGMLEAAKGELPVSLDLSGNVQIGTSPGSVQGDEGEQERAQNEAHDAAEAAELRRRVAYPRMRPGDRTNPPG